MDLKDYAAFGALLLSGVSLLGVLYKEFWQGARLSAHIDQLTLLRMPTGNQQQVVNELLLRDLFSSHPSDDAASLLAAIPNIQKAVDSGARDQVAALLKDYSQHNSVTYNPPRALLEASSSELLHFRNFALPVIVANSGRKVAHISTFILVFRNTAEPRRRWLFSSFALLDAKAILWNTGSDNDGDRVLGLFVGMSVHPISSSQVFLWFIPHGTIEGYCTEPVTLPVGHHEASLIAFGASGKKLLQSPWVPYEFTLNNLLRTVKGADSTDYIIGAGPAEEALKAK
jgi:hypothetical protein